MGVRSCLEASTIQRLMDAMPFAAMHFWKEMSGAWAGPSREQLDAWLRKSIGI